jgi:hypothetical protein
MFVTAVYHNLDFSEALEKLVNVEKNKGEDKYVYVSCPIKIPNRSSKLSVGRLSELYAVLFHSEL